MLCFFLGSRVRGNDVVLAGMTGVLASKRSGIPRSHRFACSRPLTLREGGGVGVLCLFWMDVPSAEAPACAGMTWIWRPNVRASPAHIASLVRAPLRCAKGAELACFVCSGFPRARE